MKTEKIVIKKLRGKISEKDEAKFEAWLNHSEKNQKFYSTLKSLHGQGEDIEFLANLDLNNAWNDVLFKVSKSQKETRKVVKLGAWMRYAASFIILLSVGYYVVELQKVSEKPLIIKSNEVTLETSDGKTKVLSEESSEKIMDNHGKIVGVQKGTKITYKKKGSEELVYNKLSTPNGKIFELFLSDGTKVTLNSGSSIKYPVNFIKGKERLVYLEGEAFFDVAKDSLHPFVVNSDDLDISVLGTKFNVNSYKNNTQSFAVLVEGSVNVSKSSGEEEDYDVIHMSPNEMVTFNKSDKNIQVGKVDANNYTAWMSSHLIIVNVPFQDILNRLERHFDVEIENNKPELNSYLFTATFTDENINQVMETIQKYKFFEYKINKNKLIIN